MSGSETLILGTPLLPIVIQLGVTLFDWMEEGCPLSSHEEDLRCMCRDKLVSLMFEKAKYWKQQSKVHAVLDGDSNTTFHNAAASRHRQRNAIKLIKDGDSELTDYKSMLASATSYYH